MNEATTQNLGDWLQSPAPGGAAVPVPVLKVQDKGTGTCAPPKAGLRSQSPGIVT